MNKGRLEAFSDGVLAIVITIMVLEMKAPEDTSIKALIPVLPVFFSYVLSFIYVAIYWINHHHLFQAIQYVNSSVLWANMHLLFWLSLVPFATSWMGENHIEPLPVAVYGVVLLMCGVAYRMLEVVLVRLHEDKTSIVGILRRGKKEKVSIILYFIGISLAYVYVFIPVFCYVVVALLWIIPNRKLERLVSE